MASPNDSSLQDDNSASDPGMNIAQALQDLARGEKTAQTLESNLTSLEQKLDALLKSFEDSEAAKKLDAQANEGEAKTVDKAKEGGEKGQDEKE